MTVVTDFSPDVCKDFKTTGYCGFGDNCKYPHDRSDYKQGWQLDREWEYATKGKKSLVGTVIGSAKRNRGKDPEDDEEEAMLDIPFDCIICRTTYKSPVVTKCGHYFCEACALNRYRKDPTCGACGMATNGVFTSALQDSRCCWNGKVSVWIQDAGQLEKLERKSVTRMNDAIRDYAACGSTTEKYYIIKWNNCLQTVPSSHIGV